MHMRVPLTQAQPLEEELDEEELEDELLELLEEVQVTSSGAHKSGTPSRQQVGEPVEQTTVKPKSHEGIALLAHMHAVPEEVLPEEELLEEDEVVEEPLLEEDEVVEEPLEEELEDEELDEDELLDEEDVVEQTIFWNDVPVPPLL